MGMNCAEDPLNMGMFYNSRCHSKWVCFQIPNTHIRASLWYGCALSLARLPCGAGTFPASLIETQKLLLSRKAQAEGVGAFTNAISLNQFLGVFANVWRCLHECLFMKVVGGVPQT